MPKIKYYHDFAWIATLIFSFTFKGTDAIHDLNIVEINATSAEFKCREKVIVRCYGQKNPFVNWLIAKPLTLNTSLAAKCINGIGCLTYKNFTGRYTYSYDSSTGISDLHINPVNADDNEMEYKCVENSLKPLKPVVQDVPDVNSFALHNVTPATGNNILFILETYCTTQAEHVFTEWYSTAADGTDLQIHNASYTHETECTEVGDCIVVGKSKRKSSRLELEKLADEKARRKRAVAVEEGRVFGVNVTYGSEIFSFPVPGRYNLKGLMGRGSKTLVSKCTHLYVLFIMCLWL